MHRGLQGVICTADNERMPLAIRLLFGVQRKYCFTKSDLQFHIVRSLCCESNYKLYQHQQILYYLHCVFYS
jgi:hypothetical protein